jgi:alkylation response protein AidB-like acyl-CoA dehydrogenase
MSAVEDGDDLVCNGHKLWTTHANVANSRGERSPDATCRPPRIHLIFAEEDTGRRPHSEASPGFDRHL